MDAPVWQGMMTAAYERWQANLNQPYSDFLFGLSGPERVAVLLGNLNYQVGNGGFRQWVANGYALHGREVLQAIHVVQQSATTRPEELAVASELARRVRLVLKYVDQEAPPRGFGGDYWTDGRENYERFARSRRYHDDEDGDGPGPAVADEQDDWYYANDDVWGAAVERYLAAQTDRA